MPILISVVISCSGNPVFLKRCLEALVKQTLDHGLFEVLVVSDEQEVATAKVVALFAPTSITVRHLLLPPGNGAAARNTGWKAAKGNLVAFTDDNCLPDENWLQAYVREYRGEPEAAFTGRIVVPLSIPANDFERNTAGPESADLRAANCCCTRAALEKAGGFDERFSMAWPEESDLEFKLLRQGITPRYLPDALVLRPACQESWSYSLREQRKGMFHDLLYRKYPELYRLKGINPPPGSDYAMVACALLVPAGLLLSWELVSHSALACWLVLWAGLTLQRLSAPSPSLLYVAVMGATSALIPFASVFWYWYGKWKYRSEKEPTPSP